MAEAAQLRKRSDGIYDDRLTKLPEATYGHALEHFLKFRNEPARTVVIATKNRDLRPNGEARTRLAQAYFKAGRVNDAKNEILTVMNSKWVSAESYATAAVVLRASDRRASTAFEARAVALDAHVMDEIDWLSPSRT